MGVFPNNDNRPPSSAETILPGEESSYDEFLDVYLSPVVHACERANGKPNDAQQKTVTEQIAFSLSQQLAVVPSLTSSLLEIVSSMCDIDAITQKAAETTRQVTPTNLQVLAAAHPLQEHQQDDEPVDLA